MHHHQCRAGDRLHFGVGPRRDRLRSDTPRWPSNAATAWLPVGSYDRGSRSPLRPLGASATMIAKITATTSAIASARFRRARWRMLGSALVLAGSATAAETAGGSSGGGASSAPLIPRPPSFGANRRPARRVPAAAPHRPPSPSARRTRPHRRWTSRRAGRAPVTAVATRPHCTARWPCGRVGDRARRAVRVRARLLATARESPRPTSPSAANRSARWRWSSALISSRPKIESAACGVRRSVPTRRITSTATSTPIAMMRTAPVACPGA